jgi:multidrug resistance efflux pump
MSKWFVPVVMICLLAACGGNKQKKEEQQQASLDSLTRPENVAVVSAIAKVVPQAGLIKLSSSVGGNVIAIQKTEGDTVKKGDVILVLDAEDERLSGDVIKREMVTQRSQAAADEATVKQFIAELEEKERDLAISERLVTTGAETRQNVAEKKKERDVILANLQNAQNKAKASRSQIQTLRTQLNQSQVASGNKTIRAQQDGTITSMDAKVGSSVQPFESFATLAPSGKLILQGEIDEMFASRVARGQSVIIKYIGGKDTIGQGRVTYLSPVLSDKSILYETSAEAQDRRVREFKVEFDSANPLLINHKVECTIQVNPKSR